MSKWTLPILFFIVVLQDSCKTKNNNIHKIHKIEYFAYGCNSSCPAFMLTINENKSAEYVSTLPDNSSQHFGHISGNFQGTINDAKFKKLITLLNSSDFPSLKNGYQTLTTDSSGSFLRISYDNNLVKMITDDYQRNKKLQRIYDFLEGRYENKKLKEIYAFLFALRENQNWK